MLLTHPRLSTGNGLNLSKIVRGDTLIIKFRLAGDYSTASIKFAARLRDVPTQPVVITKSSATESEILIQQVTGSLMADVTIHIPSLDTSVLDPGSVLEYDIELIQTLSYGDPETPVVINSANTTIHRGIFTLIDQVSV